MTAAYALCDPSGARIDALSEDARTVLKPGDEIEARFMAVDRKVRTIALSVKAKEAHEEAEAMQNYRSDSTTGTSLGDLLKEQISGQ